MTFGTLAFLATGLLLLATIIALPLAIATRHGAQARLLGACAGVWLIGYTALLFLFSWTTPQTVLHPGQNHCLDDVCFTVVATQQSSQIAALMPQRDHFIIVTVQYLNNARRVTERPSDTAVWLVDQHGVRYSDAVAAENALGSPSDWALLPAGATQQRRFVFDLPVDATNLLFGIREGAAFPTALTIGDENSFGHQQTVWRLAY